jgi:hypothetical protein
MDIKKILEYVSKDDINNFNKEINSVDELSDIDSMISEINEKETNEQYKIKYIVLIILEKLIKQKKYLKFKESYFVNIENNENFFLIKEYLKNQQNLFKKLFDEIDDEEIVNILNILKSSRTTTYDDILFIDLLIISITVEYLKNNIRLSSIVKSLKENKEKKLFYFLNLAFANRFGFDFIYNLLQSDIQITKDEYYTISKKYLIDDYTKKQSQILRKLLRRKVRDSSLPINREITLESKKYHDKYQNNYCKNLIEEHEEFQKELKPLIVTKTEISLPFKKILKFNRDTLYEVPKQNVHTLRVFYENNNFVGGDKKQLYNINDDFNIDLKWYVNNIKYIENLPLRDKMTIMGYTHNGDVYANTYLMDKEKSLPEYIKLKLSVQDDGYYFPLYFQAKEKIIKEKDAILKYFTGDERQEKYFIENFIKSVTNNAKEIDVYNLIVKNKKLLSVDFWIDVVKKFTKDLDRIIKESPPVETTMIVFRGAQNKYYKTSSNLYVNNTFMSTSFDYKVPFKFTNYDCCLKKIILKPGSRALFTECLTQYVGEKEILLGLDSKFKIIEDKTKYYYDLEKYDKNEEYSDNLCSEEELQFDVTVMELVN